MFTVYNSGWQKTTQSMPSEVTTLWQYTRRHSCTIVTVGIIIIVIIILSTLGSKEGKKPIKD